MFTTTIPNPSLNELKTDLARLKNELQVLRAADKADSRKKVKNTEDANNQLRRRLRNNIDSLQRKITRLEEQHSDDVPDTNSSKRQKTRSQSSADASEAKIKALQSALELSQQREATLQATMTSQQQQLSDLQQQLTDSTHLNDAHQAEIAALQATVSRLQATEVELAFLQQRFDDLYINFTTQKLNRAFQKDFSNQLNSALAYSQSALSLTKETLTTRNKTILQKTALNESLAKQLETSVNNITTLRQELLKVQQSLTAHKDIISDWAVNPNTIDLACRRSEQLELYKDRCLQLEKRLANRTNTTPTVFKTSSSSPTPYFTTNGNTIVANIATNDDIRDEPNPYYNLPL